MPRLTPRKPADTSGPDAWPLNENYLRVVEGFMTNGVEYRVGDTVPLSRLSNRLAALEHPDWFHTMYETPPAQPPERAWLEAIHERAERERAEKEKRREAQERAESEAIRRQQKERAKAEERARREWEAGAETRQAEARKRQEYARRLYEESLTRW